jgi:hypothetical protein
MKPTRVSTLLALFTVATSLGWSIGRVVGQQAGQVSLVGWSMPTTMAVLTVTLLVWTLLAKPRLLRKPGHAPLNPLLAARTAALALAASRVGALVAGVHAGLTLAALPQRETASGRDELLVTGLTVLLGVAFTVVGRWLESLCRIKSGGDGEASKPRLSSNEDSPAGSAARSHNL